jgi:hypothetical protein
MSESIFYVIAFIVVAAAYWFFGSLGCSNRWEYSGLQSKYGITTGCMVSYKGAWIPEDRYRVIDE